MLEGVVARFLNQILGKYIVDLDTENLNVGIFSGLVQLSDLKLKPEALYELKLPIEVKVGTIGKVWAQIPWTGLWTSPITVNIEDVILVAGPIVSKDPFDLEKNKRLIRAFKKKLLTDLDSENRLLGGPSSFSEYLVSNLLSCLQFNITNVHLRYEDDVSDKFPLAAGLCIGTVTAEGTNSKWKPSKEVDPENLYYMVKVEALSVYWNCNTNLKKWSFPDDYFKWRNAMSGSLRDYSLNGEDFDFVIKPMTPKMKLLVNKTPSGLITKIHTDVILQDSNLQISKQQYQSISAVIDSFERMWISWGFLSYRPKDTILENKKVWWKYACMCLAEQRIKPYSWTRIKTIRKHYREYFETYKQILLNPNDTELKLDLQKYEDHLSVVNVVIARQQARLQLKSRSISEKSFWSMLPSPERIVLCEKIGFLEQEKQYIEHTYNFRVGNFSTVFVIKEKEVMMITLTQLHLTVKPNYENNCFKAKLKVEGLIIEGVSREEHLFPIFSSEHYKDNAAYFLKADLEKMPKSSHLTHKLNLYLDSIECIYNKQSIEEIESFFDIKLFSQQSINKVQEVQDKAKKLIIQKLSNNWDMNLNIKVPFIVIPEGESFFKTESFLVIDLGQYTIRTEICQPNNIHETSTKMELEETTYSKLITSCSGFQILFCESSDNWKDAMKERETEMHLFPKTKFTSIFALCTSGLKTLPKYKFNLTFPQLKLNVSERKIQMLLKYFWFEREYDQQNKTILFWNDRIMENISAKYLKDVEDKVVLYDSYIRTKRIKTKSRRNIESKQSSVHHKQADVNEAWARCVDLPGLEDNISPNNNIDILLQFVINDFSLIFSKSSDSTDRQYLTLRLGMVNLDAALMTFGPAYQFTINNILLTDKMHTTHSGQYLDLLYSPLPPDNTDICTILYRKVSASCPDFWSHFHGVETSLVADFGTLNVLLHQDSIHTIIKYSEYITTKIQNQLTPLFKKLVCVGLNKVKQVLYRKIDTPVPPGSIKFSHSARLTGLNLIVCDSDFDLINVQLSGLELDFLFRANERFIFRSFLSNINVDHLSDITLYSKVLSTDEDKVFEVKYVRNAAHLRNEMSPNQGDNLEDSFKFQLGQIHITFLYKLVVQLQRFILNLEAFPYIDKMLILLQKKITTVTESLNSNSKTHLAINLCGPVLLFPQKSSSPNVLIFNMGTLHIENFFKEYTTETVENILVKWIGINISRGVMGFTSDLETQETLIEPIQMNMDVKRNTNSKNMQKTWEIDCIIDGLKITLGQKDLMTIFCIHQENIGEGQILELFPKQIKSPVQNEADETVKNLEAFFCESKQRRIVSKCTIEEVQLVLFFDSGELLSSPIRDLNHGLCKMSIIEIDTSFIIYTDKSLDGKISFDSLCIEEVGPDANVHDKMILQSPLDETKNNNCNITVNKPPILDVTFHQNKSGDKSADLIIGRLSLNLSVPFCEKLTLYIIECLPKDTLETGIINQGYEAELQPPPFIQNLYTTSFTLSLRINRPELIFLVETTSNKKRYFITKSEILLDYSRHGSRLNLITSLSGLHTLFYDLSTYSSHPYVILKHCDVEFCKSFSEEKGEKITLSISSVYVKMCSEVVHSVNDVLNDIIEHFKLPDIEPTKKQPSSSKHQEADLWEAKKLDSYIERDFSSPNKMQQSTYHEIFLMPRFEIVVIFELEQIQVLLTKITIELTLYNWSSLLNCTCELTLQGNYFNEGVQNWEPFIDPIVIDEREYKPWDVLIKVFQDKSLPILSPEQNNKTVSKTKTRRSCTTTEDEDSGEDMMYVEPFHSLGNGNSRRVKTSLSTFLDDSDSENEDGAMEKLAAAISDLFTGDWNENEDSDCGRSSDGDDELEEEEKPKSSQQEEHFKKSLYILVDAKEPLKLTITPTFLKVLNDLFTMYSNKIISVSNNKAINLLNDIGPLTKVELFEKEEQLGDYSLQAMKAFEQEDSVPNSPTKSIFQAELSDIDDKESCDYEDLEIRYDFETLASLHFPLESTSEVFDKVHANYLRIHIPNFPVMQTNCPKRNFEKIIKLPSDDYNKNYCLIAKQTLGKNGRNIIVSSPLQIRNETCFALNLLYQPSVLQELNLEPVGDITNPFETTMRIAILEPHDVYNVPLYIAYHCKLFVQPAYAEGHYASESGIWWKDMAAELDTSYTIKCQPKPETSLNVFCLRLILKKNLEMNLLQTYSIPNYVIRLLPPLIIHNCLPYTIELESSSIKQTIKLEPNEKTSVYHIDLSKDQRLHLKIICDSGHWTGNFNLTTHLEEKLIGLVPENKDNKQKQLTINLKSDREGSCNLYFYTPYWIVNKTGLPVQIKASSTNDIYELINEDVLLFTYKRHGKQTLNIKVFESNWSNEFGLDCAGITGLVVCKDNERKKKYLFFLNTKLSNFCSRLTKIVTLLPSFLVYNNTDKYLRFMEHNEKADLWVDLGPKLKMIFWPETCSMQMYIKLKDSKLISQAFYMATQHRTVLRMDKGSAVTVEVTGGVDGPFQITFSDYKEGDAPILIKNYCADVFLKIHQVNQSQVNLLSPYHSLLYTWDDPTRIRQIIWNVYNNKGGGFTIDTTKDGYGEEKIKFHSVTPGTSVQESSSEDSDSSDSVQTSLNKKVRKDKMILYWLCFRDKLQRVLVFTQEVRIYSNILKNVFQEICDYECVISLSGIDVSIFTQDNQKKEHINVMFSDNPAIWEVNVGHKWKTLTLELASWIENKYKLQYKRCQLKDYIHVDFEKMFMLKPFFAELRRIYSPAIYLHFRKSPQVQYVNLKVQGLQVDNKHSECIVLQPSTSWNLKEIEPFFDMALSKYSSSGYDIYRYIKIKLGDFHLNVENDTFMKLAKLFTGFGKFWNEIKNDYSKDISEIRSPLLAQTKDPDKEKVAIEHFSLTGFGVKLNVSNKTEELICNKSGPIRFLDHLFPINMVPYIPLEGVLHKITSIEEIDIYQNLHKVLKFVTYQITSQFLQQYYSHVLGMQVLVNSFAIQSNSHVNLIENEKNVNILIYASRCLLGHINMSPAALEQCIIDIFDHQNIENIQRIRRHGSYHKSEIIPKVITLSSRSLNIGVPIALNQLVVKQQTAGIYYDGETFFKTTGKALLSLISRHPDDKSDSVEIATEALKRASLFGEPIKIHQRLTRYYNKYLGLKPMSNYESMGNFLLETVANHQFANDRYWSHASLDKSDKSLVLISIEHILRVNKYRLWGNWEVEWVIELDDIDTSPKVIGNELILKTKKQGLSLNEFKIVGEKEMLNWLNEKIEQAIIISMENKAWSVALENEI